MIVSVQQARKRGGGGDIQILGGRPHGTRHEARPGGRRKLVGCLARDLGGGKIQLVGAILEFKFRQNDVRAAEGIGFDDVGPGFQIRAMDALNDVRPANRKDLGTILVSQVILPKLERRLVDHSAHGAVQNQNPVL